MRLIATRELQGDDQCGKAGVITLLVGFFGLLVNGQTVEVPAGAQYTIFIDGWIGRLSLTELHSLLNEVKDMTR